MAPEPPKHVRVLFVEDAVDESLLVKSFFITLPGFAVTHTQDGDHALRLIRDQAWDLIVTDLNLPGTDGFGVIRAARAKFPQIPILATTGYAHLDWEEQAIRAGANQVMLKPLTQNDFVSGVWAVVGAGGQDAPEGRFVLAVEGALGDALMGCGGTLMQAVGDGHTVVIVPIYRDERKATPPELAASTTAAKILGVELRVDKTLFGDMLAQKDLVDRVVNELRPVAAYMPAPNDGEPSRREAYEITRAATVEVGERLCYETGTTGVGFRPERFIEIGGEMVLKTEALAAYPSAGAHRVDLDPNLARAYAAYWGRFRDFSEVEAFQVINGTGR